MGSYFFFNGPAAVDSLFLFPACLVFSCGLDGVV